MIEQNFIPNIENFVKDIDFDENKITVELLEGMREKKGAKAVNDEIAKEKNLKVNILTLFPELFPAFKSQSIIGRAVKNGLLEINIINIRDFCL